MYVCIHIHVEYYTEFKKLASFELNGSSSLYFYIQFRRAKNEFARKQKLWVVVECQPSTSQHCLAVLKTFWATGSNTFSKYEC